MDRFNITKEVLMNGSNKILFIAIFELRAFLHSFCILLFKIAHSDAELLSMALL